MKNISGLIDLIDAWSWENAHGNIVAIDGNMQHFARSLLIVLVFSVNPICTLVSDRLYRWLLSFFIRLPFRNCCRLFVDKDETFTWTDWLWFDFFVRICANIHAICYRLFLLLLLTTAALLLLCAIPERWSLFMLAPSTMDGRNERESQK